MRFPDVEELKRVSDTIFAPSSGSQRAGVCVIRVSGDGCKRVLDELVDGQCVPRQACLRVLRSEKDGDPLDQCLVLWITILFTPQHP